jgi:hypothetical protein
VINLLTQIKYAIFPESKWCENIQIENVEFDDVSHKDYPEYVDAYVCSANWKHNGQPLTGEELDRLNLGGYADKLYSLLWDFIQY